MNNQYKCSHCSKTYSRKIYYDRHVICCSLTAMSRIDDKQTLEEQNDTPSTKELYMIIQELIKKQVKMEEELKRLRKYTDQVKRKVDVIEWLNLNCNGSDYNSWRDLIKIKRKDLELVLKEGVIIGIFNILKELLPLDKDNPVKAFEHKLNAFYIFKENAWILMDLNEFKKLIRHINQKIIQEFNEWTKEKTEADELKKYPYEEYVIRIFSNNIKESEIKTKLYDYLKISIKSITKIEV